MTAPLLVIHILLAIALIGVILLQRSSADGSGLTGGTGSMGGMMSARGTANLLTRTTSILATAFIVTSIILTIVGGSAHRPKSIADEIAPNAAEQPAAEPSSSGIDAPKQSVPAVPLSK
jgi:preprotein translocase subunit SecG